MNRYNGNLYLEALNRGLFLSNEERYTPLSIFCNAPKHIAHSPSKNSALRQILRDIPAAHKYMVNNVLGVTATHMKSDVTCYPLFAAEGMCVVVYKGHLKLFVEYDKT